MVFILLVTSGCNTESCNKKADAFAPGQPIGQGTDLDKIFSKRGSYLVSSCYLVPVEEIASLLGINGNEITIKDSSPRDPKPSHNSCFFKFEDSRVVSAGILLQVMHNPLAEEYPTWAAQMITSKRDIGEMSLEGAPDKFLKFEGFGDDGSYSLVASRYFWRLGDKVVFSIAFNTAHTPEQQYVLAQELAKKMTINYLKI